MESLDGEVEKDKRWHFDEDRLGDFKAEHAENLMRKYGYTNWFIELSYDGWELVLCNPRCDRVDVLADKRIMSNLDLGSARRVAGV